MDAATRERLFSKRNRTMETSYNEHTSLLKDIPVGEDVIVQSPDRMWNKHGRVVEKMPNRQYRVKIYGSGQITLRNRRFMKPCAFTKPSAPIPAAPLPTTSVCTAPIPSESVPVSPIPTTTILTSPIPVVPMATPPTRIYGHDHQIVCDFEIWKNCQKSTFWYN